jgi:hypothetical protein
LAELGRHDDALVAIEEAVEIYRSLKTDFPGAFDLSLASALNSQSIRLADLGRLEEAQAAAGEEETIRRSAGQ